MKKPYVKPEVKKAGQLQASAATFKTTPPPSAS